MKINKKIKIKGCACYGVNSIHPCFCSFYVNKTIEKKNKLKEKQLTTKKQIKMKTNNLTPVQWFASKSEDLRGKLTLGAISPIEYYEELNSVLKVALEMEQQNINN